MKEIRDTIIYFSIVIMTLIFGTWAIGYLVSKFLCR